jgi:hypothetical protein
MVDMKRLVAHVIDGHDLSIRPAPVERDWMEGTDQRFAYRCLPLNIANCHGWEILNPTGFSAVWDGGERLDAVRVNPDPGSQAHALSHFGTGTLTFHIPCLFETDPGVDLFATGPINRPKDGIAALTGIVEADWSPYTFTMNWVFTRPSLRVRFEAGEPICHLFPVARGALEGVTPRIARLSDSPELEAEYQEWSRSRNEFNADLSDPASEAAQARWQKSYFRGVCPSGAKGPRDHRSKLRLKPFQTD